MDIIEKLRTRNGRPTGFGLGAVCDEAASEIDRLRTDLALMTADRDSWREQASARVQDALDLVAAERERWEAAIGAVMPADFKAWRDSPTERPDTAAWCITNARAQADLAWEQVEALGQKWRTLLRTPHRMAGACPDEVAGEDSRDLDCPACRLMQELGA